ncbi:E3 ubiquitin-protein ligase E3D isoform X4 [Oxyura jamaicensis]|uniref:E3 ubiquitin-protein ligase E3D isoform X4 n=1 Tax=Oxyura jamaicensis TaxID=8884 RepID=UPI0015A5F4FF|nr:E3 ubiquitin-protein ligase E3D isoform X4 [Oxyura jamaicensis]
MCVYIYINLEKLSEMSFVKLFSVCWPAEELVYNLRESLKPQKNCIFYCQSCGDVIVKERKFLRVLPLPSENWSALVEEWCCHPNPFAKSTLHPQRDDCFLGDTFFLLNSGNESHVPEPPICCSETGHHASQNGSTLKSKENTRVFCKRCKAMLGETVSSDTIKYYVTEVIVQPSEGNFSIIARFQFVQSMVAQCLMELSSAKSTFRFTIKGDDGKIYILIWLLNSDTLLVESLGSSSSHNVFTLFEDIFLPNSGPVGTWSAIKVLYQPCIKSRNKDLADAWENDFGVHPLKFPSETCLELLLILGLSTTSLPPSLQCMNSFQGRVEQCLVAPLRVLDVTNPYLQDRHAFLHYGFMTSGAAVEMLMGRYYPTYLTCGMAALPLMERSCLFLSARNQTNSITSKPKLKH